MIKQVLLLLIFFPSVAFANTVLTTDVINGCDTNQLFVANNTTKLTPVFEPITYECSSEQFLPANTLGCKPCPNGFTCKAGTYSFNENNASGIYEQIVLTKNASNLCAENVLYSSNNTTKLTPVFEPMKIMCSEGHYLEKDELSCIPCPKNNYCTGGTYTFNETITQGISPCPESNPYAPAGMWLESQCGRKMYIADDVLYLHQSPAAPTEHRLYARIANNVYSANATPVSANQELKMSAGAQHALHVKIDGTEYLVHDDSVK